jgi:hypothetical protein
MHTRHYEITVRGRLSPTLTGAFDGLWPLCASPTAGATVLSGEIPDQAALFGVLERVDALGLELLEVRSVPAP